MQVTRGGKRQPGSCSTHTDRIELVLAAIVDAMHSCFGRGIRHDRTLTSFTGAGSGERLT